MSIYIRLLKLFLEINNKIQAHVPRFLSIFEHFNLKTAVWRLLHPKKTSAITLLADRCDFTYSVVEQPASVHCTRSCFN